MGISNSIVVPFYKAIIKPKGDVALLGFTDNQIFEGDCYDLAFGNWDINSEWSLPKKYDTIISTRCPYFAKDPELFVKKVYDNLNDGGVAYLDWGLGDHWRFSNYKIGWVKNEEHEYAYKDDNYLWSVAWDDSYSELPEAKNFIRDCVRFGYNDLNEAIKAEVPKILNVKELGYWGTVSVSLLHNHTRPQLYILLELKK